MVNYTTVYSKVHNLSVKRQKWCEDFSEWFRNVLISADIFDYRYPIKGSGVWMPYGFKIRRNILQILRNLLDNSGHQETLFPLLIPETWTQQAKLIAADGFAEASFGASVEISEDGNIVMVGSPTYDF